MIKEKNNNAALYMRLSRDDGGDVESNSIGNQRSILQKYAKEHGFSIFDEYVDDGISGVTADRPAFKRMIADCDAGRISVILCKDLSRLGRNNALISYYTEVYFIENDIRLIALNDGIDTAVGENEIMPFKSVINEYYARDISKKVKSGYAAAAYKGHYTGCYAPFGYMKDPENKHHLIPDPETAPILKRIFEMSAAGRSTHSIARTLDSEQITTPSMRNNPQYGSAHWNGGVVARMLRNRVYLGHIVSHKVTTKSFKSRKCIELPEEEHIFVPNMHEPLVSAELFEQVQRFLHVKKRHGKRREIENIYQGVLQCGGCGRGMDMFRSGKNVPLNYGYQCNRYRRNTELCSSRYISLVNLNTVVLEAIQRRWKSVKAHEKELAEYAWELFRQAELRAEQQAKSKIIQNKRRREELDVLIKRLFEQNTTGILSDDRFLKLINDYETEQKQIEEGISQIEAALRKSETDARNTVSFSDAIRQYTEVTELTSDLLRNLIESIQVMETHAAGAGKIQRIIINFRFIKDKYE